MDQENNPSQLAALQAQKAALDAQISAARAAESAQAVQQAKELIELFDLRPAQLFGTGYKKRAKVEQKYRDPVSGKTWSGRGRTPLWVQGDKEAYRMERPE